MDKRVPYSRPVLTLFVFLAVTVLCLFIIRDIQFGESKDQRYLVFSIRFEYFGMDAPEMERLITIPLEEKISALNEIQEIRSAVEYGKSLTTVYFNRKVSYKNSYLALRDAVDTLYNSLPRAVQKPKIYSSGADSRAVLSVAVTAPGTLNELRRYIDGTLKKELEGIDGVAELIVSGGTIDEIRVEFDADRLSASGLNPAALGSIIQDANVVSPGGTLYGRVWDEAIAFNTRIRSLDQIKGLPVKAGEEISSLGYFADIHVLPRKPEEILRINGRECIGIQVKSAAAANIIRVSRQCREILGASGLPEASYQILYDTGELLESMIRSVIMAIIQSFICVIIIIPFFFESFRVIILLLLLIPINIVWTAAVLYLLGFSIDQNILSGISISLGLMVDSALVIAGIAEAHTLIGSFAVSVKKVLGAIIASSLTTILVLIPLFFLDVMVPGIRNVAAAITIMLANSLLLSCIFFPGFVFSNKKNTALIPSKIFMTLRRFYIRMGYRISRLSLRKSRLMLGIYALFFTLTFVLFFISGKNISLEVRDAVIYAAVEYDPEKTGESIDAELQAVAERIRKEAGVSFLRMESRKGTAELEIGFDEQRITRHGLATRIAGYASSVHSGFLYVPDAGSEKKRGIQEIEIAAVGDETGTCREYARVGASAVSLLPGAVQTVLNFKNPEQTLRFLPDRDMLARSGISVEAIASTLRWTMFGPVVDKWIEEGTETDIRVAGRGLRDTNLARISNLHIPGAGGGIRLDTLGELGLAGGSGKIYRRDGRRAAYFTVHINASSTDRAVKNVTETLAALETDKGYGYLLPRELELLDRQYRLLLFAFIGSITGVLLLLTGLTENFFQSAVITSIIPVSCMFPLLVKFIFRTPLEMGDIVGMIVISGISVNNAIYIAESAKPKLIFRVREKIQSILVTSLTSIAGAIPLAIMSSGGFSGALASTILWGSAGSLVAALLLFPAVYKQFIGKEKSHVPSLQNI